MPDMPTTIVKRRCPHCGGPRERVGTWEVSDPAANQLWPMELWQCAACLRGEMLHEEDGGTMKT